MENEFCWGSGLLFSATTQADIIFNNGAPDLIPDPYFSAGVVSDFAGDFEYDAAISPITLSPGATYLLSIVNDTSGSSNPWAWWEADIPGLPPSVEKWFWNPGFNSWIKNTEVYNQAFYLSGPNTSVPEPATMLLLGSGLIGLAGYGRKKFFKK